MFSDIKMKPGFLRTQNLMLQVIHDAVLRIWGKHGLSIERLGKLERVEYFALTTLFDLMREN